jgi:choline dehydrogenase-like flavoprotein
VVVIGAGVAGALLAWRLTERRDGESRPCRVLLIDAGPAAAERAALVEAFARASAKTPHSPYADALADRLVPSPDVPGDYEQASLTPTHKDAFKSGYEMRVGGSTWHWLGHTPRLVPGDFAMRSRYGVAVDWPIDYATLEPWYAQAERALGVAGDVDEWRDVLGAFRSTSFPMSKVWPSYSDLRVAAAIKTARVESEGVPFAVFSTPSARNTQPYDGRPPCAGNSSCVPLCPIGAKYDGAVHVKKALAAGTELRDHSAVSRLVLDADGKVVAAEYRTWDGQTHRVAGRVFVIAAHAIETPRLLLASAQEGAAQGIANRSGQVGRNLMDHLQKAALGLANEPLYPYRGPPSTSGIDVTRDGPFRAQRSAFRISLGNDGWSRAGAPYSDVQAAVRGSAPGLGAAPLFGRRLREHVAARVPRQLRLSCSTEVLPSEANRVTLSEKVDALGRPVAHLEFRADEYTKAGLRAATRSMAHILDAVGVTERVVDEDFDTYSGAGHIMGTCRMGIDPASSVVGADCRSHDHANLFIVGGSVFPTCGTANPTLTIAALALRAAATVRSAAIAARGGEGGR